jgi:hypothetical protein
MREHTGISAGQAASAVGREHAEPSGADRTRLQDLGTRLAGHRVSLAQAVELLAPAARDVGEYSKDVTRLVTIMENLARNLGPIHGRMDQLEQEVRGLAARQRDGYNQ